MKTTNENIRNTFLHTDIVKTDFTSCKEAKKLSLVKLLSRRKKEIQSLHAQQTTAPTYKNFCSVKTLSYILYV